MKNRTRNMKGRTGKGRNVLETVHSLLGPDSQSRRLKIGKNLSRDR
jgi:hypothetical protein